MTTGRRPTLPVGELDDTADDLVTSARREPTDPGRRFPGGSRPLPDLDAVEAGERRRNTGPIVRVPAGEVADGPTETDEWEWARDLKADLADLKRRIEADEADRAVVKRDLGRAKAVLYSGAGLIGVAAIAVLKLAFSAGGESASARQHQAEHRSTMASVSELQTKIIPDLMVRLAEVKTRLDEISRLGAVRVQGPPPQPLLPGDP